MKKISFLILMVSASFAFFSCNEDLIKSDFDYKTDVSKISTSVTLDMLEQVSEEGVHFKATIIPSNNDEVYDQGIMFSTLQDFSTFSVLSVKPDTTSTGIFMEREEYKIAQGSTFYFKAFVKTKEGMALSNEVKSVFLEITWQSLGNATFIHTWMFDDPYTVELQQFMPDPTRYRLVDPFAEGLEKEGWIPDYNRGTQSPYWEFQILPKGSVFKGVTTTVDGLVVYDDIDMGYYHPTYDDEVLALHPSRFSNMTTENFWMKNIVTRYSDNGDPEIVQIAPYFYIMKAGGGWNMSQFDDIITIIFPGVVVSDYSAQIEYTGYLTDASDEIYALANVTLGADVVYGKVALVAGSMTQAILDGVIDGTIESEEIYASGEVSFPLTDQGRWTYVVVSFDGTGEEQDFDYTSFNYVIPGVTAYPIEDFYGDYIMTGLNYWDDTEVSMPVTIAEGPEANTLEISGIDYAGSVIATFPVKGYMSIAPQELAEKFTYQGTDYDMDFYTITPDYDLSDTDAMIFTRLDNGALMLSSDSYAIGYFIAISLGGVDGFYDISFAPVSTTASSLKSAASRSQSVTPKPFTKSKANIMLKNKVKSSKDFTRILDMPGSLF